MRQFQSTSTIASHEQRGTHIFFQVLDLAGQRRLADTQHVGSRSDTFFPHHRDEITQYLDFHNRLVPPPYLYINTLSICVFSINYHRRFVFVISSFRSYDDSGKERSSSEEWK